MSAGDALNFMILDTACPMNVAGQTWLDCFIESLDEEEKMSVIKEPSDARFRFGSGPAYKSLGKVSIPVEVANSKVILSFDVVECDVPLLLGKQNMKEWDVVIHTKHETADFCIDGVTKTVGLFTSKSNHWCIPIHYLYQSML